MSIEFSNVEQRSCEPQRCSQKVTQVSNKGGCTLFEDSREGVEPAVRGLHRPQGRLSSVLCSRGGLLGGSPTLVRGFLGNQKIKPLELMLKVDNIIPLWRSVILNMVSESCP